jgi:hypothetical protein
MKSYASSSSLSYAGYTVKFSQENRQLFPNIASVADSRDLILKVFDICPDIAQALLDECNGVNRNKKPTAIEKYSKSMADGKWFPTHQGIAFGIEEDEDSLDGYRWVLFDGQNRLEAVVKSGVPTTFLVFFGFREGFQIMNSIDTGKNRNHGDSLVVLQKAGKIDFKSPQRAASILNAFWRGSEDHERRLDTLDLQGLAIAASKGIEAIETKLYSGISPLPKASVSGALLRAFYSHCDFLDKYSEAEFVKRLRLFVEIVTGNEVTHPVGGITGKDSYAFAFRKWCDICFPKHQEHDDVMKKLRSSMGGGATSLLYSVAERAIYGFLGMKSFPGFAAFKRSGKGSKLWRKLDEGVQSGKEVLTFPLGVSKRAKTEAKGLAKVLTRQA